MRAIVKSVAAALACAIAAGGPAAAETAKVRIASQFGLVYLPIIVAHEQGYFRKEAEALGIPDLEVTIHTFSGSTAIGEAVLSNNADFGAFGTPGLLIAWEKTRGQQHIKGVASLGSHTHQLFTNKANYQSLADFVPGDQVAAPAFSSPQAILLRTAFDRLFGSPAKAEGLLVSMPHPEALKAVLSGTIAGYISSPPFSQILERDPRTHSVWKSSSIFEGKPASAVVLGATQAFVEGNPKLAKAVVAGLEDAGELIRKDPKRAAEIYLGFEKVNLPRPEIERILTDGSITYGVAPHGIIIYGQMMQRLGMLKTVPAKWQDAFFPVIGERDGD
jgi:NitT/TauT family transport system substrate-binding protein